MASKNEYGVKCDFKVIKFSKGILMIEDLDAGNRSITNDAENLVPYLLADFGPNITIYYLDSSKSWCELDHDGKQFINFMHVSGPHIDHLLKYGT